MAEASGGGCAFGLDISANQSLEALSPRVGESLERVVAWERRSEGDDPVTEWDGSRSRRLVDLRFTDGRPMMSVDVDVTGAYRVQSPGFGDHLVTPAGDRIVSVLAPDASWAWQRLFVAQALPLAATLQGLEPLHASAVNLGGRTIALTAPSGTGKTSVAVHLVARGAVLVTDDVLALELTPTSVLAHPGARILGVYRHELDAVGAGGERLGRELEESEKVFLAADLDPEARPLAALYILSRGAEHAALTVLERCPPSPRDVLATAFLPYVEAPARLARHLELAARLVDEVRVFDVGIPEKVGTAQVAASLQRHAASELG